MSAATSYLQYVTEKQSKESSQKSIMSITLSIRFGQSFYLVIFGAMFSLLSAILFGLVLNLKKAANHDEEKQSSYPSKSLK